MKDNKKAKLGMGIVSAVLMTIIVLIVILQSLADTGEDVGYAATNVSAARLNSDYAYQGADVFPLTSFMKKKGIILLALMAGLAITVIVGIFKLGKSK